MNYLSIVEGEVPEVELANLFPNIATNPILGFEKGSSDHTPTRVGVLFSGGPAPGGHNVVAAIFDTLTELHEKNTLVGIINGPKGLLNGDTIELDAKMVEPCRGRGGFDLLGTGREKIENFELAAEQVKKLKLDGLIIIGGDDSNTNAAHLAEYFAGNNISCAVVGVPKTIDGDLRSHEIEISFGFDSACTVYSEIIGNLARDAKSAKKYTFFVKLMGRNASHVTLECALRTHPNMALITEEIASKKLSLSAIVRQLTDLIEERSRAGKEFGIILIPEGIVNFMEADGNFDPHGNLEVAKIESERLLIMFVKEELERREFKGNFNPIPHYCGYEGRTAYPTPFDAEYTTRLGQAAALLAEQGMNGYIAAIENLAALPEEWEAVGVPMAPLMTMEMRGGKEKAVIAKKLLNLDALPFRTFKEQRTSWRIDDDYQQPLPNQLNSEIEAPYTLRLRK